MDIANRLKKVRELKGATQMQVSKETGINNKTLSGYERGVSEPDLSTLVLLADYYSVSTDFLLEVNTKDDNNNKKIHDLSPESQKELERYKELLKAKEYLDKSKEEQSSALEKDA